MEGKSVFISSCSRRELSRRRPTRPVLARQGLVAVVLVLLVLAAFFAVHGL